MAVVKPFCAIRPRQDIASRVAALPYDVYNRAEAKLETQREPLSFLCIDRAETQLPDDVDTYDERVYAKARSLMKKRIEDNTFVMDSNPCYYIYELVMDGRSQTGIVGCASIDDYISGVIKKHENTRADKEVDRINHVDALSAQTGPIFLAYRGRDDIKAVISAVKKTAPLYDFTSPDGITHRVWAIREDKDIRTLGEAFADTDSIYIADGHHRCASAVKVGLKRREEHPDHDGSEQFNYFLSVLFAGVTYYVSMQATGAKKGDEVYYNITANLPDAQQLSSALDMPTDLLASQTNDVLSSVAAYDVDSQLNGDKSEWQNIASLA